MSPFAEAEPTATGRTVDDLETPAAVIDLDRLDRNLERVAGYAAEHELGLYPHTKTHKTLEIAARQLELGARGLTVAKSEEAEGFAELGAPLLVHYPVVGAAKVERIVALAERVPVTVAVDSFEAAEPLALALIASGGRAEALIEIDVGLRRTGVEPAAAGRLAAAIGDLGGGLEVAGISCYPGSSAPRRGRDPDRPGGGRPGPAHGPRPSSSRGGSIAGGSRAGRPRRCSRATGRR